MGDTQVCSKCKEEKPLSEYYIRKDSKRGFHKSCKKCKKVGQKRYDSANPEVQLRSSLKFHYGITIDDYYNLLDKQNAVCAICYKPCATGKRLAVDHNHDTGEIRGLLCHHCNTALGSFQDSPELLLRAIAYLKEYSG